MTYRVLIADDHLLVRMGIRALLPHLGAYEIVGEAEDGRSALEMLRVLRPDIVLIDIAMPEISGIEAVQRARQFDQQTRIIFLSALDSSEVVRQALSAGANGYLLKDFVLSELELALQAVQAGSTYLSPSLSADVESSGPSVLTARQLEILRLIASGASSKEIAKRLAISPKTVEFHRSQMMERLGLHDIASLTLYAERHGLLPSKP